MLREKLFNSTAQAWIRGFSGKGRGGSRSRFWLGGPRSRSLFRKGRFGILVGGQTMKSCFGRPAQLSCCCHVDPLDVLTLVINIVETETGKRKRPPPHKDVTKLGLMLRSPTPVAVLQLHTPSTFCAFWPFAENFIVSRDWGGWWLNPATLSPPLQLLGLPSQANSSLQTLIIPSLCLSFSSSCLSVSVNKGQTGGLVIWSRFLGSFWPKH